MQDETFNPYLFDAKPYAGRLQYLSSLFDATNPDLSGLAAKGGKVIIMHPSADNATPLTVTGEYYRSVVSKLGQATTDQVMRVYVGPGGSHNVGGTTQIDALSILEKWVLNNELPPDAPIAYYKSVTDAKLLRSMPACRYPMYAQYKGSGDINAASSFTCTTRPDPLALIVRFRGLLSYDTPAQCKAGDIVMNTARGGLGDEAATR